MNRRDALKAAMLIPAAATVHNSDAAQPTETAQQKQITMFVHTPESYAITEPRDAKEAVADLEHATKDIATILARGRVYPSVPEPKWLTEAVNQQIDEARERVKRRELERLRVALCHWEKV